MKQIRQMHRPMHVNLGTKGPEFLICINKRWPDFQMRWAPAALLMSTGSAPLQDRPQVPATCVLSVRHLHLKNLGPRLGFILNNS